jgi:hypothetical protein
MIRNTCRFFSSGLFALIAGAAVFVAGRSADAFPICNAVQSTLSEDLRDSDAAAVVRLVHRPPEQPADAPTEASQSTFEVVELLTGEEHVARSLGAGRPDAKRPYRFKILYFGEQPVGSAFLAFGARAPTALEWGTPIPLGDAARDYVGNLLKLPAGKSARLGFFLNYLEHGDPLLADDAFDELAKVEYGDIAAIQEYLPREKLIEWISEPQVATDHRRLYFRMLSLCAKAEDVDMLKNLVAGQDDRMRKALDALIFSYLALEGPAGMPLVENLYLKNPAAEFAETYMAIMALRNVGSDTTAIPQRRLAEGLRHILSRPEIADLVIGDLMRMQDWGAMPRLVELFKTADPTKSWVRVPVLLYLRACPLPEAGPLLESLSKLDPEAAKKMKFFIQPNPATPDSA